MRIGPVKQCAASYDALKIATWEKVLELGRGKLVNTVIMQLVISFVKTRRVLEYFIYLDPCLVTLSCSLSLSIALGEVCFYATRTLVVVKAAKEILRSISHGFA